MNARDETTLGRVVRSPERLPERQVFDAEIVEDDHLPLLASQRDLAYARWRAYRTSAVTVIHTTRTAATHERTRIAGKAILRHALYVLAGALVVGRRVWEAKTNSRYERVMRAAEQQGDWDRLEQWEQRAEQARERRHRRRMDWLAAPWQLAKALLATGVTAVAVLLVLGLVLAAANHDVTTIIEPIMALVVMRQVDRPWPSPWCGCRWS